jgi:spore maturation protein CgeB
VADSNSIVANPLDRECISLRVGLVCDELTRSSLSRELNTVDITPLNFRLVPKLRRPDFLLVESAWQGKKNRWKYGIASYPDYPKRNNIRLKKVITYARDLGIPTIFWNKEDSIHFDRFINSAKLFDHVFTVDENAIPRYKEVMGKDSSVHSLMFGVQPIIHGFTGFNFKYNRANFVGSYSTHVHDQRRERQKMLFESATKSLGLTIVDRNSKRKSTNYRYPELKGMDTRPAVSYKETAQIYKDYLVSLNVNTVDDSPTMFSRRLIEIIACGGIAVTTPAESVDRLFKDYCHIVNNKEETEDLFSRLVHGPSKLDMEMAEAGAHYILQNHTWAHRIDQIRNVIGI